MTIPWINCTERMPPDDEEIIIKVLIDEESNRHLILKGTDPANTLESSLLSLGFKWIPYDEEIWRELNHERKYCTRCRKYWPRVIGGICQSCRTILRN